MDLWKLYTFTVVIICAKTEIAISLNNREQPYKSVTFNKENGINKHNLKAEYGYKQSRYINNTAVHADNVKKIPTKNDKVKVKGNYFVDSKDRILLFHGLNVVEKKPPWYPKWLLNNTKLFELQQYGFNVLRLGTMWTGIMPIEGQINRTYINILQKIVTRLG